jgi:plasmid maintenance system antidote protein VapI
MLLKLVAIQRREGLTDGQMAARLGVSRPWWNRVKNGRLPFTDEVAVRAVGVWPELTRDLLDRAQSSVRTRTNIGAAPERVA